MAQPPLTHSDYQVGIICALATEKAAMVAILDKSHPRLKREKGDDNDYTLGKIGDHNVAIACLPAGLMGNGPAAIVANNMQRSFPIKFGLMVGLGGGVWSKSVDVRLGDVVVSQPTGTHGGVVQWDFGKLGRAGEFQRTSTLNKPPAVLLHALQELKTFDITDGVDMERSLSLMLRNKPRMGELYRYQGADHDHLFEATYDHTGDESCEECDPKYVVKRNSRNNSRPIIHYGNIASGNEVMKHGVTRDRIAKEEEVICFEMEAAGLMDNFPCLVIRGICDYADSHKNKIWQMYAAATAAAFARELLGFIDEQEVIKTPPPSKPFRVLPFGRNKKFIGREFELDQLRKKLYEEDTEEDCQRAALVGLGGVGKTQIALEFAFQVQKLSPGCSVFWVRASDVASFESAYCEIGRQLKIPGLDDDKANIKQLVKMTLSQESAGKWILIVDNADDFELLYKRDNEGGGSHAFNEYLPFSVLGAILFTTRDREAATRYAGSNVLVVQGMSDTESKELFKSSLQNQRLVEDEESIAKLLKLFENLPLAIMQAISYINTKGTTAAKYLKIYEESNDGVIKLLSKDFDDRGRYPGMKNPIVTTWLISFDQIRLRDPLAADYMSFMSCINEQDIPRSLLPPAPELEKTDAIGTLKAFGFIKERLSGESYDMHRLVHIAMQNWLKINDELTQWNKETLKRIADVFPWPEHENKNLWTMYLSHAQHIMASTEAHSGLEQPQAQLIANVGECFYLSGRYLEAEQMNQQALCLDEQAFGVEHPNTLQRMNNLASALQVQGKHIEAEQIHKRTLELRTKILGLEHPDTLQSMNNLANALRGQGKHTEAEQMHKRNLELCRKILGIEHPDTLQSMNNLAAMLQEQGKHTEAEQMHKHTLDLRTKILGIEHPATLQSMNDLANALQGQGKYTEAERMHKCTLKLRTKILGIEHPNTLGSMSNLATVIMQQDGDSEAEEIFLKVLEVRTKVLGVQHPDTLISMHNLAFVLFKQEKYMEAEQTGQRTVELRTKVSGVDHLETRRSRDNLVKVLQAQGKHEAAEELLKARGTVT